MTGDYRLTFEIQAWLNVDLSKKLSFRRKKLKNVYNGMENLKHEVIKNVIF